MKSSKTTRFGFLTALILLGGGAAPQALAGVYDDVAYWFRGVNNNSAPTIPQLEDWDECPNALYLNLNGGHGRIGDTKDGDVSGDRWVPVTGQRKDVCANEVMDVPMPYARRIQKSRSPVHFKQPTYRNPGDETLYGTQNFIGLTNPFSFENTNAYTAVFRIMHEGYVSPTNQRAGFANVGYGWSADTGSGLILLKDDKGDDNLSLYFALGLGSYTSNYPQTLDERDHIGVGKWIDFGLSCSNGVMRFYYAVEGGSGVVELPNTYSSASWKVAKSSICCLGLISTTGKSGATDSVPQSKMYVHRFAVWPHALTKDEMTAALSFPRPNIAQFGIANGSDSEFAGMSPTSVYGATDAKVGEFASLLPSAILPGSPFAVECTVEDGQAASNQVVRLRALPGFDPAARLRVTFDGTTVTNFADHVAVSSFAPDANGVYEVGVRRELIGAPGAHTLRLYAEGGEISIDSLTFGNFGRRIFLPSGKGAVLIVR